MASAARLEYDSAGYRRFEAEIALDDSELANKLRPGLSVVATVRTRK